MDGVRHGGRTLMNALLLVALRWGVGAYLGYASVHAALVGWRTRSRLRAVCVLARIVWLCARSRWQTRRAPKARTRS